MEQTTSQYLRFIESPQHPKRKTKTIYVETKSLGQRLGTIAWFPRWRQYCFFPSMETIYSQGCLADIHAMIHALHQERRK